ncbi:MAG TPA: DinB family protein [Candidatus Limnocylindria bacterium]|nr:DinB family protein [Candidatus Limnocylindria bacterium]
MSERVVAALGALRARLAELEAVVRETTDRDWERDTAAEHWPVGLVAFHIARGFQRQAEFIEAVRDGRGPHRFDWEETHALNAAVADAHRSPSREEVIRLARASVERIAGTLASMDEATLAQPAFAVGGRERDAVWVAGRLAPEHARGHLESIAATIAAA